MDTPPRHGCLLTYLIFMIVVNSIIVVTYGAMAIRAMPTPANIFPGLVYIMGLAGILNIVFAVALLAWKKWGFYGFCASAAIIFVINLVIGINPIMAFVGLIGPAILYGVLQIGGDRKGIYLR
jgi:hypothetical protein